MTDTSMQCLEVKKVCRLISHPDTNGFLLYCRTHNGEFLREDWIRAQPELLKCKDHDEFDDECDSCGRIVKYFNSEHRVASN